MDEVTAARRKFEKELKSGTAALLLLGILAGEDRPMYGYEITGLLDSAVDAAPEGAPRFKQGALYPVLRSLERGGILESRTEPSVSGPPRKYYSLTATGRKVLDEWSGYWEGTSALVDSILKGTGE